MYSKLIGAPQRAVIKTKPAAITPPLSHTARARAAPCGGACGGRRSRCAPPLGVGSEAGREGDAAEAGEPIDEAEPLGEDRAVLRGTLGEGLLRLGHEGGEQRRLVELLVAHLVRSAMASRAMVVEPWWSHGEHGKSRWSHTAIVSIASFDRAPRRHWLWLY